MPRNKKNRGNPHYKRRPRNHSKDGKRNATAASSWKPAYGVSFNPAASNTNFIYFADLNNDNSYPATNCSLSECIKSINITRGNYISDITVVGSGACSAPITRLSVVITRPDSSAIMSTNQASCTAISSANITVSSPKGFTSQITIYASGRVQVN